MTSGFLTVRGGSVPLSAALVKGQLYFEKLRIAMQNQKWSEGKIF